MIQAVLFPVFNYIASNKWAQIVAGLGVGFIIYRIWLAGHDARVEKVAVRKANDRAEKQSDKILKEMESDSEERIQDALEARERVPDGVTSDQLSDDARAVLFGTRSDSGGGGGY